MPSCRTSPAPTVIKPTVEQRAELLACVAKEYPDGRSLRELACIPFTVSGLVAPGVTWWRGARPAFLGALAPASGLPLADRRP